MGVQYKSLLVYSYSPIAKPTIIAIPTQRRTSPRLTDNRAAISEITVAFVVAFPRIVQHQPFDGRETV